MEHIIINNYFWPVHCWHDNHNLMKIILCWSFPTRSSLFLVIQTKCKCKWDTLYTSSWLHFLYNIALMTYPLSYKTSSNCSKINVNHSKEYHICLQLIITKTFFFVSIIRVMCDKLQSSLHFRVIKCVKMHWVE